MNENALNAWVMGRQGNFFTINLQLHFPDFYSLTTTCKLNVSINYTSHILNSHINQHLPSEHNNGDK